MGLVIGIIVLVLIAAVLLLQGPETAVSPTTTPTTIQPKTIYAYSNTTDNHNNSYGV
jgi:hypothetical protein